MFFIIFFYVVVKELAQQCVGGIELQHQRQKIQSLADETNVLLKKNVYQNYMQFIETAKEISRILFSRHIMMTTQLYKTKYYILLKLSLS